MAHILLVEDDSNLRSVLADILKDAGYQVSQVSDGTEVSRHMEEEPIDLVLTDILMPEQEGIQTIVELRRNYPEVKIIGMSGGGRGGAEHYLETARGFGAQDTLKKPFKGSELLDKINAALKEKTRSPASRNNT